MKVMRVFLLLVVFAVGLSGCARYQWRYTFPPGGTQSDFNRDIAYCNDYARTWCATNGTMVVSGSRQDYSWGQRNVNISGNRACGDQQLENVRNDCMGMKGYTYTREKVGQERSVQSTQPKNVMASEAKAHIDRGIDYGKQGQLDQAIAEFTKAIEINPRHAEAYYNRAVSYYRIGDYGKSWEDLEKAKSLGYNRIHPGFLEDLQKKREAMKIGSIPSTQPKNVTASEAKAYIDRGIAYENQGQYQEAIESYKQVTRINPNDDKAYSRLGSLYGKLNRFQEAIDACKEATRLNSNDVNAYGILGATYSKLGRHEEAIEAFKQTIRISPNDPRGHFGLSVQYGQIGRYDEAIEALNQAIRINPNNANAYNNRGYVYLEVGKDQSALQDLQKAIELDKNKANSYVGLSIFYLHEMKIEEAKNYYKKAIEIEPSWKLGPDALEKEKRYWFPPKVKQNINEILSLL